MPTRPKILLIDDDKTMHALVKDTLSAEEYNILSAMNGEEGLEVAKTHTPHLIILDKIMPGMDGHDVLKELKKAEKTSDIPVIMMTGRGNNDEISICLNLGAADYIAKPFDEKNLAIRVKKLLGKK